MTDPIADMLSRIRNAIAAARPSVSFPYSKIKEGIAGILKANGYIADYQVEKLGDFKTIVVTINHNGQSAVISNVNRLSKPGHRLYSSSHDIPQVLGGRGLVIVSTPSGLMTGKEAKKRGLGGELICQVW